MSDLFLIVSLWMNYQRSYMIVLPHFSMPSLSEQIIYILGCFAFIFVINYLWTSGRSYILKMVSFGVLKTILFPKIVTVNLCQFTKVSNKAYYLLVLKHLISYMAHFLSTTSSKKMLWLILLGSCTGVFLMKSIPFACLSKVSRATFWTLFSYY